MRILSRCSKLSRESRHSHSFARCNALDRRPDFGSFRFHRLWQENVVVLFLSGLKCYRIKFSRRLTPNFYSGEKEVGPYQTTRSLNKAQRRKRVASKWRSFPISSPLAFSLLWRFPFFPSRFSSPGPSSAHLLARLS